MLECVVEMLYGNAASTSTLNVDVEQFIHNVASGKHNATDNTFVPTGTARPVSLFLVLFTPWSHRHG